MESATTATLAKEEFFGIDINEQNVGPTNIYHIETCNLVSLTVFKDKAELCRSAKPQLKVGKISMVVFKRFSPSVDRDSFRVEVSGPGLIRDVYFRAVPLPDDEKAIELKRKAIKDEIFECNKQVKLLSSKLNRLKTQKSVIDGFSETLVEKRDNSFKSTSSAFDPKHMETLNSFLNLYDSQVEKIDCDLMETEGKIDSFQEAMDRFEMELKSLDRKNSELLSRELTVMLECKEADPITLSITYVVGSCQWTPSYDLRVYSNDGNMKILYYGVVQQNTGEDWEPRSMLLSTSSPGIGENAPEPSSQNIKFKDAIRRPQKMTKAKRMTKALSFHAKDDRITPSKTYAEEANNLCFSDDNLPIKEFEILKSPVKEALPMSPLFNGIGNFNDKDDVLTRSDLGASLKVSNNTSDSQVVNFVVPRPPVIIPGDELPHRCLVGIIDLHPTFEYVSAPRKTPYAFLKANCHNGSHFAILTGPANVFIDNNFIGKTSLGNVAPQEEFTCNLGVDHGIKINYKPIFKYREASANSRLSNVTFKQLIEIKNNHERNIRLFLKDQLPISNEDKIKIHLQEPLIKHNDKNKQVRLTKTNIIEWDLEMHPNESKELTLKYTVEYPQNEEIDVAFIYPEI